MGTRGQVTWVGGLRTMVGPEVRGSVHLPGHVAELTVIEGVWGTHTQQHRGSGPCKSRWGVGASSSGHERCEGQMCQAGPGLHLECL